MINIWTFWPHSYYKLTTELASVCNSKLKMTVSIILRNSVLVEIRKVWTTLLNIIEDFDSLGQELILSSRFHYLLHYLHAEVENEPLTSHSDSHSTKTGRAKGGRQTFLYLKLVMMNKENRRKNNHCSLHKCAVSLLHVKGVVCVGWDPSRQLLHKRGLAILNILYRYESQYFNSIQLMKPKLESLLTQINGKLL